jgi:hypothetical protein
MSKFCEYCRGTGEVECDDCNGLNFSVGRCATCITCDATSRMRCPECDGFDAVGAAEDLMDRMKEGDA